MKSITVRGLDEQLQKELEKVSRAEHKSLNKTILSLLKKALGMEGSTRYPTYDDLDHLAGTWTEKEKKEFNTATSHFSKIDKELWK